MSFIDGLTLQDSVHVLKFLWEFNYRQTFPDRNVIKFNEIAFWNISSPFRNEK
jgi:hypothetical protein